MSALEHAMTAAAAARRHLELQHKGDARAFLWRSRRRDWSPVPMHPAIIAEQRWSRFAWLANSATRDGVAVTDCGGTVEVVPWSEILTTTDEKWRKP